MILFPKDEKYATTMKILVDIHVVSILSPKAMMDILSLIVFPLYDCFRLMKMLMNAQHSGLPLTNLYVAQEPHITLVAMSNIKYECEMQNKK